MMVEAAATFNPVLAIAESKSPSRKAAPPPPSDGDPKAVRRDFSDRPTRKNDFLVAALGLFDSSKEAESINYESQAVSSDWEQEGHSLRVRFHSNRETGRISISVIDAMTDEVIRQIPSEELQRVTEKLKDNMGQMFDRSM